MHVGARGRQGRGPAQGFSLLEVVIAAGLLLLTITIVTATAVSLSEAGSRLRRTMAVDRVLRGEAERLRALPYCAASYPAMTQAEVAAGRPADDLVGGLFPHAMVSLNRDDARFVAGGAPGDEPAGAFVTVIAIDDVTITRVARFLADGGSSPMGADAVVGWGLWGATPPPAAAVDVELRARAGGLHRECRLVCGALVPEASGTDAGSSGGNQ